MPSDLNDRLRAWHARVSGTPAPESPADPDPDAEKAPTDLGQGNRETIPVHAEPDMSAALRALLAAGNRRR